MEIDNLSFFCLGGAVSIDKMYRTPSGFRSGWRPSNTYAYLNLKDFELTDDYLFGVNFSNEYEITKYFGRESNVVIPASYLGVNIVQIRGYSFYKNLYLNDISIPETVLGIGDHAFEECSGIKEVKVSSNCEKIGNNAFYNCSSLKYVLLPFSVTSVGDDCFDKCSPDLIIFMAASTIPNGFAGQGWPSYVLI